MHSVPVRTMMNMKKLSNSVPIDVYLEWNNVDYVLVSVYNDVLIQHTAYICMIEILSRYKVLVLEVV